MKRRRVHGVVHALILAVLLCIPGITALGKTQPPATFAIRRFAFIVGSNDGGPTRVQLQYATSDASSFAQVMTAMGGVDREDSIILMNPSFTEFSQGMSRIRVMMGQVNPDTERREFILYYSGHSDEEGLLLGHNRYSYSRLRRDITDLPAEVHIAILDSCSSGAMTRSKGGVRKPAFLFDASNVMEGHAFLTSSSADEAAQESDSIEASFFTHYLVSGLRGAADATGDGKVTLNEAYHYAFTETLASTEKTRYGAQHPTYDISLTGTGDIILTDLRETSAGLVISKDINGRLFVRDSVGALVVELNKPHGNPIDLGLEPGSYEITLRTPEQKYQTRVIVEKGERAVLSQSDLKAVDEVMTVPRGDQTAQEGSLLQPAAPAPDEAGYTRQFARLGVVPSLSFPSTEEQNTLSHLSFNVLWGEANRIEGLELGLVGNVVREDMVGLQLATVSNTVRGDLIGMHIAGFHNYTGKDMRGAQMTAGVNRVHNHAYGTQVALIGNYTRGDMIGLQLTGFAGITWGSVLGAQIAGFTCIADYVSGAQIGLVNLGYSVRGLQLGLINIAEEVAGSQVGLVNISQEMDGEAVGLFTISRDGRRHFEVWGDSTGFTHLGFRLGTSHVYTLFTAAYNPFMDPHRWSYGLGLGGEIPLDRFFINLDAVVNDHHSGFNEWYAEDGPSFVPEVRALGGYSFARRFGMYAGGSLQFFIPGWYSEQTMAGYLDDSSAKNELSIQWTLLAGLRF